MSRYAWPALKKKGHSGVRRVEWDMRTSGLMTERAVSSARDAEAFAGSAFRAPGTDTDHAIAARYRNPVMLGRKQ